MKLAALCLALCVAAACSDTPAGPPSGVDPGCGSPLALRVGEVRMLSGSATVSCIAVEASTQATDYLFIAANAKPSQDDLRSYLVSATVTGTPVAANTVAAQRAPGGEGAVAAGEDSALFSTVLEDHLRQAERALFSGRSLAAVAGEPGAGPPHTGGARASVSATPSVGDTLSYRVGDATSTNLCTNFQQVRGVVQAVSAKAIVVQDVNVPAHGFTAQDYRDLATEFDALIYPVDAQWFGDVTDINGDGHVTILYTPIINRLTPPGSVGFVGGFFFSSDLTPRSNPPQGWTCDGSNEQEIIFLLAADPDGQINGNRHSVESSRESARGTAAHELQHMINQGVRQTVTRADQLEVKWLNEGLSHFAEEAVGRAARGYSDFKPLTYDDALADLDDFDSFFRQNLLRFRYWMVRPDLASPISQQAATQLAPRGAAWALVRYAIDRYSNGSARTFTRALVAGPQVDVPNLEARTHAAFGDILPGFLVANFVGDGVPGLASRFTYSSWAMHDAMTDLNGGVFPLRVTPLPAQLSTQSLSGSGNYFMLSRPAGASAATFRMLSASGGSIDFTDARVYVVRIK